MDVHSHDGRLGFGGLFYKRHCGFDKIFRKYRTKFSLLKKVIEINNKIRSKYEQVDKRERDQNVTYNLDD